MNDKTVLRLTTFPSLGDLLAMLGLFLVVQVACSLLGMLVLLLSGQGLTALEPQAKGLYLALVSLASLAITAVLFVLYRRWRHATPISFGLRWRPFDPMLLVWGFVVMAAAAVLLEPLFRVLPTLDQDVGRGVAALLAVVVIAPLFEEFICRGLVYGSLRLRYGERGALLLSALFFGLLHLQPAAVVNAFVMGLVLAFVYRVAGTLWAAVALHALNNLMAYLQMVTGYADRGLWELVGERVGLYVSIYMVAAALMIIGVISLRRMPEKHDYIGKNTNVA